MLFFLGQLKTKLGKEQAIRRIRGSKLCSYHIRRSCRIRGYALETM